MIEPGATVAPFTLCDQDGNDVAWDSLRGKPVVFFFYPKANTPGCTTEACAFRDLAADFEDRGVTVIGVSADTPKRQASFATKYDLTMPLLADPDHRILEPWGVWAEKRNYGKTYMGIVRSTFLFDADGTLRHVWPSVRVKGHAEAVLATVDELFGTG
jgi:peroxiredoxin Q/BCP